MPLPFLGPQGLKKRCCAWVRGQFLKPEEGSYGHISEGFILAEFYLLRVSIQNLGEWLTCDLALQVNFLYV